MRYCPNCNEAIDLKKAIEIDSLFGFQPVYRCSNCDRRFPKCRWLKYPK